MLFKHGKLLTTLGFTTMPTQSVFTFAVRRDAKIRSTHCEKIQNNEILGEILT